MDERRTRPDNLLARSRTKLTEARQRLGEGDTAGALACAQAGLDLLGRDYSQEDVDDDTGLTLALASCKIRDGEPKKGAKLMLQVLEERIESYAEGHAPN